MQLSVWCIRSEKHKDKSDEFNSWVSLKKKKKKVFSLTLSTGDPFDADPPEDEHGAVVVDVEEADLVELLPEDEKDCIQELHAFGDVVPPESRCYLKTQNKGGVN